MYGGFNYIFEPSFGFIIGFLASSLFLGLFSKKKSHEIMIASFFSIFIIYVFGVIYFYVIFNYHLGLNKDLIYILEVGVLPFIIKDLLSAILASLIYFKLNEILKINIKKEFNLLENKKGC